jgi:hypothetical protein
MQDDYDLEETFRNKKDELKKIKQTEICAA